MNWGQVTVLGCNGCKAPTALIPPFQEPILLHPLAFGRKFLGAESIPHGNVLGAVLSSHSAFWGLPRPNPHLSLSPWGFGLRWETQASSPGFWVFWDSPNPSRSRVKGEHYATGTMGFCIHRYNFQGILGWQVLFPHMDEILGTAPFANKCQELGQACGVVGFAYPLPLRQNPMGKRHQQGFGKGWGSLGMQHPGVIRDGVGNANGRWLCPPNRTPQRVSLPQVTPMEGFCHHPKSTTSPRRWRTSGSPPWDVTCAPGCVQRVDF